MVLKQILESPLYCKESRPVNPKGNQPWIFTGGTDAEAEVPKLWPLDEKSWRIGKDFDAGKDQRQKEKGVAEGEMARWHHRLSGHKFEQTPGDSEDRGAWCAAVHGVAQSPTPLKWLSTYHNSHTHTTTVSVASRSYLATFRMAMFKVKHHKTLYLESILLWLSPLSFHVKNMLRIRPV